MKKFYLSMIISMFLLGGCDLLKDISLSDVIEVAEASNELSTSEIIQGLKEALNVGTKNAVNNLSKTDGFFKFALHIQMLFRDKSIQQ